MCTYNIYNHLDIFSLDIESFYTNIRHDVGTRFVEETLNKLRPGQQYPSNKPVRFTKSYSN